MLEDRTHFFVLFHIDMIIDYSKHRPFAEEMQKEGTVASLMLVKLDCLSQEYWGSLILLSIAEINIFQKETDSFAIFTDRYKYHDFIRVGEWSLGSFSFLI